MIKYMARCIAQYPDYETHPEFMDGMSVYQIWHNAMCTGVFPTAHGRN